MDAFEQLVGELYWLEKWWTKTSVKINLTSEDKAAIKRTSNPRWEIDVVAYSPGRNELRAIECKSYFDSRGVNIAELIEPYDPAGKRKNYKLFRDRNLRLVLLNRLKIQLIDCGLVRPDCSVKLAMVAGKTVSADLTAVKNHFAANDWIFHDADWLREKLKTLSIGSYENDVAAIVSKILLRI